MPVSTLINAAFAAVLVASAPGAEVLQPAFNNTIVSTYPSGRQTRLWLHPDGTYDAQRTNGERTQGVWKIKAGEVCMTQKRPFYVPLSFCTAIPPVKGGIGASWRAKGLKGEPVTHTLTAGAMPKS